jgi:hypothetical protein
MFGGLLFDVVSPGSSDDEFSEQSSIQDEMFGGSENLFDVSPGSSDDEFNEHRSQASRMRCLVDQKPCMTCFQDPALTVTASSQASSKGRTRCLVEHRMTY